MPVRVPVLINCPRFPVVLHLCPQKRLLQEESERLVAAQAKIVQANRWAYDMGLGRSYELLSSPSSAEPAK